jgi:hypothetical protein
MAGLISVLLLAASASALSPARCCAVLRRPRASVQLLERRPTWKDEQAAPIRNFLCQRAAQTLLFYAVEFRNDFEKGWLLRFSTKQGMPDLCTSSGEMLHAHDAFEVAGVSWEEYMHGMLRLPDETHQVTVLMGHRIGGGSPNNPYLKKERQVCTYEDTLSPENMARRLLTVRETLAREWQRDLLLVGADNAEIQAHHTELVKNLVDLNQGLRPPVRPIDTADDGGS